MGGNRNNDYLNRSNFRRKNEAVVIAVSHDDSSDHTGGGTPGSLERILEFVVAACECDVISTGEFITEIVGSGTLQCFMIFHQAFHGVGRFCSGKFFLFRLSSAHNRDCKNIFKKVCIAVELLFGLCFCFFCGFVDGVPFLPPEFTGTKERSRSFLPADDRAPLVVQHWEFAVGMQDLRPVITEHSLRSRTESKSLFKLFAAAHSDPCYLRCKSVDEFPFFFEKAFRDQDRHCHVDMSGFLELCIHDLLHILPDGITIGAKDGKALNRCILDKFCFSADIGIPLSKILLHIGNLLNFFLFRHIVLPFIGNKPVLFHIIHAQCAPLLYYPN